MEKNVEIDGNNRSGDERSLQLIKTANTKYT